MAHSGSDTERSGYGVGRVLHDLIMSEYAKNKFMALSAVHVTPIGSAGS